MRVGQQRLFLRVLASRTRTTPTQRKATLTTMSSPSASVPMKVEQLKAHPEYPHVIWDLKPDKKAKLAVAKGRGGPFNISYEVHGRGPTKLVFVMGLGSLKASWQRQTKDFGHKQGDKYQILVFDNRGMGESDHPKIRYSTSEMAKDVIELVDHLGWTEKRQLNIIGISMGGMISQELALLIPERIMSLSLISTAPYISNDIGYFENLRNRINLLFPKSIDEQLVNAKRNCYTAPWLALPDETECVVQSFPTNGDRFAAMEVRKRTSAGLFTRHGFILQAIAAGWHRKSPEQLRELGDKVGRDRILVVHGTKDNMVSFSHGEKLLEMLGGKDCDVTWRFLEGQSHVMPVEMRKEFNGWIEEIVAKGKKLNG